MTILSGLLSILLLGLAALHLLWGIGYWFPIRDETALVRAVVGAKGAVRMPGPIPCGLVVVGMMFAIAALWWPQGGLRQVLLAGAAVVFLGRGLLTWSPFWRRVAPAEPFATLDRRFYGPLALFIGAGFVVHLI